VRSILRGVALGIGGTVGVLAVLVPIVLWLQQEDRRAVQRMFGGPHG
jgi:hypothetical protein